MAVDVKLFLAWHPFLFLWLEGLVKSLNCGSVLTAVGGGTRNIHPLSAVKSTGNKLADKKRVKAFKKTLNNEIKAYNALVDEYEVLTRSHLTRASEDIPADILAGKPFAPIPSISYTANDGTARNSDADVAAVAANAAREVEEADKKKKYAKKRKKAVQKTALEEKVAEQANKDVSVLTKATVLE